VKAVVGMVNPLAIIVPRVVYDFSPGELQALALRSRAGLVVVDDGLAPARVDERIAEAIAEALKLRSSSATNYAVFAKPIVEKAPAPIALTRPAPSPPAPPPDPNASPTRSGLRLKTQAPPAPAFPALVGLRMK